MRICEVTLKSATPYSQSKMVDPDIFPKKEKEDAAGYDARLWREKATYDNATGIVAISAMSLKMSVDEAVKRLNIGIAGRGYTILPSSVTHWMPLPPPPIVSA